MNNCGVTLSRCYWVALCMVLQLTATVMPCEYSSIDPRHTMCSFRARQCSGKTLIKSGGVSCQMRETILNSHNKLRQKVSMGQVRGQPPAINMRRMVWDEELAKVAQRWADQCMPGHDRSRNVERFTVGQNVAAAWTFERDLGDTPDFVTQVEAWFNEVTQYGFAKGSVDPFRFNKATGHYTQMAWAKTHMVGCGFANYKDPSKGYTKIYVCNYGPGGNVIGGSMYKLGHPGEQYCVNDGLRPSTKYQGLCESKSVDYTSCGGDGSGTYLQPPPAPPSPSDSNSLHHDPGHHDTRAPGHMMPPAPHQMPPSHHPEHPSQHDQFHPEHGFSSQEHSFQPGFSSEHGFPHGFPSSAEHGFPHGFPSDHGHQEHGFPSDGGFPSSHPFPPQDNGFQSDHEFQTEQHGDGHDVQRPDNFLMKGIHRPFMGLMKILNPWNILNRFAG